MLSAPKGWRVRATILETAFGDSVGHLDEHDSLIWKLKLWREAVERSEASFILFVKVPAAAVIIIDLITCFSTAHTA